MKLVLLYSELRALLAPVIPHACTDGMLPVLCQIPVAASGEHLVAQATDRFTAAFKRVKPATPPPDGFYVRLQATDAKRMLNLLRPSRGSDPEVTIEPTGTGEIRVSSKSAGFALGFTGLDLEFLTLLQNEDDPSAGYPDLSTLLPTAEDLAEATSAGCFSLPFMARFKVALDTEYGPRDAREEGVNIQLTKHNKPMVVTVGDDFVGLVMPRRPTAASAAEVVEAWRGQIPVKGVQEQARVKSAYATAGSSAADQVYKAVGASS